MSSFLATVRPLCDFLSLINHNGYGRTEKNTKQDQKREQHNIHSSLTLKTQITRGYIQTPKRQNE
jgi:hypothetical protein